MRNDQVNNNFHSQEINNIILKVDQSSKRGNSVGEIFHFS